MFADAEHLILKIFRKSVFHIQRTGNVNDLTHPEKHFSL